MVVLFEGVGPRLDQDIDDGDVVAETGEHQGGHPVGVPRVHVGLQSNE